MDLFCINISLRLLGSVSVWAQAHMYCYIVISSDSDWRLNELKLEWIEGRGERRLDM
jgi:hypothetical protein